MEPTTPFVKDDRVLLDMPGKTYAGTVQGTYTESDGDVIVQVILDEQPDMTLEWPEYRLRREA